MGTTLAHRLKTPLAHRLQSTRRLLRARPQTFEWHQLLRVLRRADPRPVQTTLVHDAPGVPPAVHGATPPTRGTAAAVELDAGLLPDACDPEQAAATVSLLQDAWEVAHPFAEWERGSIAGISFAKEAHAFGGAVAVPAACLDYAAHAAGCFRRGGSAALAAVCMDYFGVPVRLEPINGKRGRLHVGPLTLAEYLEIHAEEDCAAAQQLFALGAALLGPAIDLEIVLVLKAEEVPPCVPGTIGARVGLTAWPRQGRGPRRDNVQHVLARAASEDHL